VARRPRPDAATCADCAERATIACPRCQAQLCGFHGPFKAGAACRACEAHWDARRDERRRVAMLAVLLALGIGGLAVFGVATLVEQAGVFHDAQFIGLSLVFVAFAVPVGGAWLAVRLLARAARRRFLAERPAPSA
jgi:hypothetical protein